MSQFFGWQGGNQQLAGNTAQQYGGAVTFPQQRSWMDLLSVFPGLTQSASQTAASKQQGPSLFSQIVTPLAQAGGMALGGWAGGGFKGLGATA
jgi:hypothetical protein